MAPWDGDKPHCMACFARNSLRLLHSLHSLLWKMAHLWMTSRKKRWNMVTWWCSTAMWNYHSGQLEKKHSAATRSCSSTKCVRRDDGVDQPWPMGPIPKSLIVVSFYMFLSPWPIRLGWLANMIFPSCCFWNFDQLLRPPAQVPMRSANVHSIRVLQTCLTQGIQIYI